MAIYSENSLGARLKSARENKKFSQKKLADMCGVSTASIISNWETNTNKPDLDKLILLCDALDVSPAYLLDYYTDAVPLSADEKRLVEKYRRVDERGAKDLLAHADYLVQQMENYENDNPDQDIPEISDQIIMPVFLTESDEDYPEMKKKCRSLRTLKRNSRKSYLDITKHLWKTGYGEIMCLAYVIQIFGGDRVPSRQLYDHIADFLKN